MKKILNLYKKIQQDLNYVNEQFSVYTDFNILFLTTQLTGKELYKSILPFLFMFREPNRIKNEFGVYTNITGLEKYNPKKQLLDFQIKVTGAQLAYTDVIVIPFTTQPLAKIQGARSVYQQLRDNNRNIKIIYHVDFNFYLLDKSHPLKRYFPQQVISDIEDNIFYSDITIVTNTKLGDFLHNKFSELKNKKYKGFERINESTNQLTEFRIANMPLYFDEQVLTENVEVEFIDEQDVPIQTPPPAVNNPSALDDDLILQKPEKEEILQKKIFEVLNKKLIHYKIVKKTDTIIEQLNSLAADIQKAFAGKKEKEFKKPEKQNESTSDTKMFRLGIIASDFYFADLIHFRKILKELNLKFKGRLEIVEMGLHEVQAKKLLGSFDFEYHPPVSNIHYFKKLKELQLDLLFVPLRKNEYNETSENYNKFIEASMFKIPLVAPDMHPYNLFITNNSNGFLLKQDEDLINLIDAVIDDKEFLEDVGEKAYDYCRNNLSYTEDSVDVLYDLFIFNEEESEYNEID
jgi:hypothetical protein